MSKEALKLALEALEYAVKDDFWRYQDEAINAVKEALAKTAQPKYRRGDRLICLETEEFCVIHISGTDRQWVKFPTSYIGVYTNEQVAELFELLPKEPEQEPVAEIVMAAKPPNASLAWLPFKIVHASLEWLDSVPVGTKLYTSPQPARRKPLTKEDIRAVGGVVAHDNVFFINLDQLNALVGIKENTSPPPQRTWVGLTGDEVTICHSLAVLSKKHDGTDPSFTTLLHQQIEAKLKEKNT